MKAGGKVVHLERGWIGHICPVLTLEQPVKMVMLPGKQGQGTTVEGGEVRIQSQRGKETKYLKLPSPLEYYVFPFTMKLTELKTVSRCSSVRCGGFV